MFNCKPYIAFQMYLKSVSITGQVFKSVGRAYSPKLMFNNVPDADAPKIF